MSCSYLGNGSHYGEQSPLCLPAFSAPATLLLNVPSSHCLWSSISNRSAPSNVNCTRASLPGVTAWDSPAMSVKTCRGRITHRWSSITDRHGQSADETHLIRRNGERERRCVDAAVLADDIDRLADEIAQWMEHDET